MQRAKLLRNAAVILTAAVLSAPLVTAQQARPTPPRRVPASTSNGATAPAPAKSTKQSTDVRRTAGQRAITGRDPAVIFGGGAPQTVDELRAMQDVTQRLSEQVMRSTVGVRVGPAQGSGVIVTKEGHVLTAAHVAGTPGRSATFILNDGRTVRGKTLGAFYDLDAGLLQITDPGAPGWQPAAVGESKPLRVGQWCLGTGHPGGFERGRSAVVRLGRILRVEDDGVTTDITLVGGDSGGPLFDMEGRVIGIHSRIGNALTTNIHVPVSIYRDNWERLVKGDAWGLQPGLGPFIGVVGARDAEDARIAHVNPGSPAEQAGIKVGDVITKFDGRTLRDFSGLSRAVAESEPGERVKIEVRRGERTLELAVVIGSRGE
jgi:serine protease Do